VLLSGGELTVSVTGAGHGGPNREYLLGVLAALHGREGVWALAADTDGIDGSDGVAGGWIGPDTLAKARLLGLDPNQCSKENDSARFFRILAQEIITGPTRTNVNDLRAILILPKT
jgi:hydroxypyruvate reductase